MNRLIVLFAPLLFLAGCAQLSTENSESDAAVTAESADQHIAPFSVNAAGGLPDRWDPLVIFHNRKRTRYQLVADDGKTVLHAYASEASSGLMQHVNIDPLARPWINWQWKIGSIMETAHRIDAVTEDSPARVILGFDGDKGRLSFGDQIMFEAAKAFTGHDFPYATLMYIWDKNAPVGTIMPSHRSERIKMLVVANSSDGVGQWQTFTRNVADDFEKAYGEKPGQLIGVGVLTDTDNLGETVEAWYGDIDLREQK